MKIKKNANFQLPINTEEQNANELKHSELTLKLQSHFNAIRVNFWQ